MTTTRADGEPAAGRDAPGWEQLANFRDLGGLPAAGGRAVRSGVLLRSASVAYASATDAALLIGRYRLATVIDLRGADELLASGGRGPLGATAVGYHHVPISDLPDPGDRAGRYLAMLRERGAQLAGVVRLLARPGTAPALIHCQAGADRTGVAVAAVLALVGVADDDICTDYARTAVAMQAHVQREVARRAAAGTLRPDDEKRMARWIPEAATMVETLRLARTEWGDLVGWATAYGVSTAELTALREVLLTPGAPAVDQP